MSNASVSSSSSISDNAVNTSAEHKRCRNVEMVTHITNAIRNSPLLLIAGFIVCCVSECVSEKVLYLREIYKWNKFRNVLSETIQQKSICIQNGNYWNLVGRINARTLLKGVNQLSISLSQNMNFIWFQYPLRTEPYCQFDICFDWYLCVWIAISIESTIWHLWCSHWF